METAKPIVVFSEVLVPPTVGASAVVRVARGYRHHTLGKVDLARQGNVVTTSAVQSVNNDGSFVTLNSRYVPLANVQA
jgi:hypothetical protein